MLPFIQPEQISHHMAKTFSMETCRQHIQQLTHSISNLQHIRRDLCNSALQDIKSANWSWGVDCGMQTWIERVQFLAQICTETPIQTTVPFIKTWTRHSRYHTGFQSDAAWPHDLATSTGDEFISLWFYICRDDEDDFDTTRLVALERKLNTILPETLGHVPTCFFFECWMVITTNVPATALYPNDPQEVEVVAVDSDDCDLRLPILPEVESYTCADPATDSTQLPWDSSNSHTEEEIRQADAFLN